MQRNKNIFIVPMRGCPVFPGVFTTVEVSDPQDIEVIKHIQPDEEFGLLLLKDRHSKNLTESSFYQIGTTAKIKNKITTLYGSESLYIETVSRFIVKKMTFSGGLINASVQKINEKKLSSVEEQAMVKAMKEAVANREDKSVLVENIKLNANNMNNAARLSDYLCGCILPAPMQQKFLEITDIHQRTLKLLEILNNQLEVQKIKNEIQNAVSSRMNKHQREFFLREELNVIQKQLDKLQDEEPVELTDEDISKAAESTGKPERKKKLIDRLKDLKLTGEARDTVFKEYEKLQATDTMSPEHAQILTYLETVASLPWNTNTPDVFNIQKVSDILNKDHYGIKDVKQRILEYLAVKQLNNDRKGSIICLVGPPGTGKTSIGASIARALERKYYRFSVGGLRDEAEIKGHRRTYIGSMPGQIIKGLKVTKTSNPVFVIDEIDKMGESHQGDPASALLEVLDPEQNIAFRDNYLDIPFDISNILFILTANSLDTIPRPLLDRMEIIELSGYTSDEKLEIGKKYIIPKSLAKHGLKKTDIKYSDTIIRKIAEEYAREAGVRNFEKSIDKIHRKVAYELVTVPGMKKPVNITNKKLFEYLGQPVFHEDEIIKANKVGLSVGLAWTSMGGDTLAIEALAVPGKGELKLTGKLGDVMKESASIALSYIKSICSERKIQTSFFTKNSIHLHVPEGATPKDGPSAGITMATALYSLLSNQIMAPDMAMTGELSLLGKVMPIGGLKEKVLAARRNKIKTILIPAHNKRDLDKLEENVKEGITFKLVSDMKEVLSYAFPGDKYAK